MKTSVNLNNVHTYLILNLFFAILRSPYFSFDVSHKSASFAL